MTKNGRGTPTTASRLTARGADSHCSRVVQSLGLRVEGLALATAVHRAEPLDVQFLSRPGHALGPATNALESALAVSVCTLRHNLAVLVLHQSVLLQATSGLRFASTEDKGLGKTTLGNLRHTLRLHGFHCLHCFHSLHSALHAGLLHDGLLGESHCEMKNG